MTPPTHKEKIFRCLDEIPPGEPFTASKLAKKTNSTNTEIGNFLKWQPNVEAVKRGNHVIWQKVPG